MTVVKTPGRLFQSSAWEAAHRSLSGSHPCLLYTAGQRGESLRDRQWVCGASMCPLPAARQPEVSLKVSLFLPEPDFSLSVMSRKACAGLKGAGLILKAPRHPCLHVGECSNPAALWTAAEATPPGAKLIRRSVRILLTT